MLPACPVPQFPHLQHGGCSGDGCHAGSSSRPLSSHVLGATMPQRAWSQVPVPTALLSITECRSTSTGCHSRSPGCVCSAQHRSALQSAFCSPEELTPALESLFGLQVTASPWCLPAAPALPCPALLCLASPVVSFGFSPAWPWDLHHLVCSHSPLPIACVFFCLFRIISAFLPLSPHPLHVICCNLIFGCSVGFYFSWHLIFGDFTHIISA